MKNMKKVLAAAAIALATVMPSAHADLLLSFSNPGAFPGQNPGDLPPTGSQVFATALFQDMGAGTVRLTMSVLANILPTGSFVNDWYFNISTGNSAALTFTYFSGTTIIPGGAIDTSASNNQFKPDGTAGDFDMAIHFNTGNDFNGNQLAVGNTSVYDITAAGLTASMFNVLSENIGQSDKAFTGAVHVQGYGSSTWIGDTKPPCTGDCDGGGGGTGGEVPEPAGLALIGLGLLSLRFARQWRRG